MKAILRHRLTLPVLAALVTSTVVAAVSLGQGPSNTPPPPAAGGQAAGQLTLADGQTPIPVLSYSWGASNPATVGSGSGISSGRVSISSFNIMKVADANTSDLFTANATGIVYPKMTFATQWVSGNTTTTWTLVFDNAMIDSIQHSGSGNTAPTESVSIAFEKVTWTYKSGAITKSGSWNLKTGTP